MVDVLVVRKVITVLVLDVVTEWLVRNMKCFREKEGGRWRRTC